MPDRKGTHTRNFREKILTRFECGYTRAEIVRDLKRSDELRVSGAKKLHGPNDLRLWVNWALCSQVEIVQTSFASDTSYKHKCFVEKDVVLESEKLENREDRVEYLRDNCPTIRKRHEAREQENKRKRKKAEEEQRRRQERNAEWDW